MRRVLLWLLGCVALWGVLIYALTRPRTWAALALLSERISYGAREAHNTTKQTETARQAHRNHEVKTSTEPLPDSDNVIDAIRYFLQEKRGRGP